MPLFNSIPWARKSETVRLSAPPNGQHFGGVYHRVGQEYISSMVSSKYELTVNLLLPVEVVSYHDGLINT